MTRRITLTIVLTVLISVLLAGIGTLFLMRAEDRRATREDLEQTAAAMSFFVAELPLGTVRDQEAVRSRLTAVREELRIADAELLVVARNGEVFGQLPAGLDRDRLDLRELRREGDLSGSQGPIVYAAVYDSRPAFDFVVVLTADGSRLTQPIFRWISLSTVLALAAGSLLAWMLGRRLAAPMRAASSAAHRIASGDLSVRLPVAEGKSDEITELSRAINGMALSLDRSRGLERHFLLSVSHDLRTPLTSIRGYAEAIADGTATDSGRAAEVIQSEASRLERLVTDLLDLARLDARQFSFDLRTTDLAEVVPDLVAGFEHQAHEAGLEVVVAGGPDSTLVSADPDRLAQAVANLLENALKFASSSITVTYGAGATGPEIVVADDGPGIASDELDRVFERLYVTEQRPQRREVGSGLGLAIVKELVEAMGGSVRALPRPSGGTQFLVTLRPA